MKVYPSGTLIVGRYEVAGRPLMGGMGIVYLCMDRQEDRPVALKTFRPEFLPDRAARDRFLREGTTWVDLGRHPHIVHCYSVERVGDGREVYLSLELVAHEQGHQDASLRSWLTSSQPLPVEQALLFALQIARGMGRACERIPGFVHRDLKPENVLVGADRLSSLETNRLRVTDFGLANNLQDVGDQISPLSDPIDSVSRPAYSRTQLTHGIVGTPLYMAPEQWQDGELGIWTDVYAVGCMLYEMLTGEFAVEACTQKALKQAHCEGQIQSLPASLPTVAQEVVEGCLHLKPKERYQTWVELETALGAAWEAITDQEISVEETTQELNREERVAMGWSYNNMGASYLDIGKADVALTYFEKALNIGQAEVERNLEAVGLISLGLAYSHLGNFQQAIDFYDQGLKISHSAGYWKTEISALSNLGNAYFNLGDARPAINYQEQCLKISQENRGLREKSVTLVNLGNAYASIGEVRRAISYYQEALVVFREIDDRRGEGDILGNLGLAYDDLGDARRAIGYHEQALKISREIGDRHSEGSDLGNLGNAYFALGEVQRAIGYFEQYLIVSLETGDRHGEGNALGSLGNAYAVLGDAHRAIDYFEQTLAINHEIGDILSIAMTSANLGLSLLQIGEIERTKLLLEKAIRDFKQAGYYQQAQKTKRILAQILS
jgi:serine/threonine protein kinase